MAVSKTISKAVAVSIYSGTELFFVILLYITMNFGNTTLRTEYTLLHGQPVSFFGIRSGFGIFLSTAFAVLQTVLLIFGKRILGIEKYSYRKIFIYHLLVYSFLAIVFIAIRFYGVLNSDPSERVE